MKFLNIKFLKKNKFNAKKNKLNTKKFKEKNKLQINLSIRLKIQLLAIFAVFIVGFISFYNKKIQNEFEKYNKILEITNNTEKNFLVS
jgi:hypothetical protein